MNDAAASAASAASSAASDHVRVGCFCIVASDSHPECVLLGRRLGSHGAGKLAMPGGHLEFGESFAECLVREVKEETNLDINVDDRFPFTVNSPPSEEMGGKHYVTVVKFGNVLPTSAALANMEPAKCEGWNWVEWEDLMSMDPAELFDPLRRMLYNMPVERKQQQLLISGSEPEPESMVC